MKIIKITLALALSAALLSGCKFDLNSKNPNAISTLKIASFNVSLDRSWFGQLVEEMQTPIFRQQVLVDAYVLDKSLMSYDDRIKAEKIIQVRNIAAIIQTTRPEILFLKKFNNDGYARDMRALKGFQQNYLEIAQSRNSIDSGDLLNPIFYPYLQSFATNSGENSGLDLDNDGSVGVMPGDAWGDGNYHGQRAFALMSMHEIDRNNTRTFQDFRWKDIPNAQNPVITNCNNPKAPLPNGMACGDKWYSVSEWNRVRLSSQNHVDVPIKIKTNFGDKTVHFLIAHPAQPVELDSFTNKDKLRNRDEIQFWNDYINDERYIYDDKGRTGGLNKNDSFIILGDLNADPDNGDSDKNTILGLLNHPKVNGNATVGNVVPISNGAVEEYPLRNHPSRLTSVNGLRVDYVIPSNQFRVEDSGVYWPASGEEGHLLINDSRIGELGTGKEVSSDHRIVWVEVNI